MKTFSEFLDMGGYGAYIWGSVLMCAAVMAAEMWSLVRRRRALKRAVARDTESGELTQS